MNKKLSARVLAGAVLSTLVLTFTPASAAVSASGYEKQVVDRTNLKRTERDIPKVKTQSCVDRYAEKQGAWMAKHQQLKHQSMKTVLDACNLKGVSENIAYGYTSGTTAVSAWMKSSGHRHNLLDTKMRYIGVGAVKDGDGVWWVSQVFGRK
jgi:uncharacterized protein YkwD